MNRVRTRVNRVKIRVKPVKIRVKTVKIGSQQEESKPNTVPRKS